MSDLTVSPDLLAPLPSRPQPTAQMRETAQAFEASFLAQMMKPMFEGLSTDGPFGGGQGEEMFKSFMNEAMAKQVVKSGGVGIADDVAQEMLKLQGLS